MLVTTETHECQVKGAIDFKKVCKVAAVCRRCHRQKQSLDALKVARGRPLSGDLDRRRLEESANPRKLSELSIAERDKLEPARRDGSHHSLAD